MSPRPLTTKGSRLFREKLMKANAIKALFNHFDAILRQCGYIAMSSQIVDASLIAAPRQRNTIEEKQALKEGRIPDEWKDKPAKLRQKDRDARWNVKFTKAKPREDGSSPTWVRRPSLGGLASINRAGAVACATPSRHTSDATHFRSKH